MSKTIKLKIDGKPMTFNVDVAAYDKYLNELTPNNKIAPARNFLTRTVAAEDREALKSLLEKPSAGLQVATKLVEEFTPDIEIELGE
jgi:hypothetical protein